MAEAPDRPSAGRSNPDRPLRYGWTTGACATGAVKAALTALVTGRFPDPVTITLPGGQTPAFALAREASGGDGDEAWAEAGIIKDAGDDPDVTHGALVMARVQRGAAGSGVTFRAGMGVGTVTKPGLPLPPGEPAINPAPRAMIRDAVHEVAVAQGVGKDVIVTLSVPDGEALAKQTWNPRLGIVGGLSILGTTGIVVPYSCAAWIDSIHRGVDVARATGTPHIAAAVGATSEGLVRRLYDLPDTALIDMGDFAGGLLKYLRRHPVPKLTIAGGFAKMSKLAQGHLDLHSGRSQVDTAVLAALLEEAGAEPGLVAKARGANTALDVLRMADGYRLGDRIAEAAKRSAVEALRGAEVEIEIVVSDREGRLVGRS